LLTVFGACAGLYILLQGMRVMKEGLENLSREKIRRSLATLTATPVRGALTGTLLAMLTQSSTAVSVLSVGFVNAGLMGLEQAVAVLLGANVGTCVTVQLISLDLFRLAVPAAVLGLVLWALNKRGPAGQLGHALFGFGLVFTGLWLMADALAPLQHTPWFNLTIMYLQHNHLLAVLAGVLTAALLHSSAAATGIVMLLSNQGLITLPAAVAIVLGNNIGTCVTAVLASIGGPRAGKQTAAAHVLLNLLGAAIFLPLIKPFALLLGLTAGDLPRQIANAHTIFNIVSSLAVLPVVLQFTALVRLLVPDRR